MNRLELKSIQVPMKDLKVGQAFTFRLESGQRPILYIFEGFEGSRAKWYEKDHPDDRIDDLPDFRRGPESLVYADRYGSLKPVVGSHYSLADQLTLEL